MVRVIFGRESELGSLCLQHKLARLLISLDGATTTTVAADAGLPVAANLRRVKLGHASFGQVADDRVAECDSQCQS